MIGWGELEFEPTNDGVKVRALPLGYTPSF